MQGLDFAAMNIGAILLILAGIVLIGIEMFLPGFGVPGIAGGICLIAGIAIAANGSWSRALLLALLSAVVLCLMLVLAVRSARKGRLSKGAFVLGASTSEEAGFNSADDETALLGKEGCTLTVLRPSGSAEIAGRKLDVVTEAEFIAPGTRVRVVEVEGRRIVVRAAREDDALRAEAQADKATELQEV